MRTNCISVPTNCPVHLGAIETFDICSVYMCLNPENNFDSDPLNSYSLCTFSSVNDKVSIHITEMSTFVRSSVPLKVPPTQQSQQHFDQRSVHNVYQTHSPDISHFALGFASPFNTFWTLLFRKLFHRAKWVC